MDGDGNVNGSSEDLRYVRAHLNVTAPHIDENFIKLNDGKTAQLRDKINFAVTILYFELRSENSAVAMPVNCSGFSERLLFIGGERARDFSKGIYERACNFADA